jgi:LmbE family N-acetylglucosaminyl deacetylase
MTEVPLPSRKEFLLALVGGALLPQVATAQPASGKLLIVTAHPDDEYAFAAVTYRLVKECGWTADQVVITNGESGYRYATLAETFYGVPLADTSEGRANLAEIRKQEARNAGKILGIRQHYFLDQRDLGFDTNAASADGSNWDRPYLRTFLSDRLSREKYDVVFTLLPTAQTHGHHRAATLLALEAVSNLAGQRPLILGAEPRGKDDDSFTFSSLPDQPLTRTLRATPALVFDREAAFGYRESLNYQIVANWVIAEHKSQGLFQKDYGQHRYEQFWLFGASGETAFPHLSQLQKMFEPSNQQTLAQKGTSK